MRISNLTVAVAALALSSCGSETSGTFTTDEGETGEYTIDQNNGEASMTIETPDGAVSMRTGADVPVNLPAGFSLFTGAEILSNTIIDQEGEIGALVTFTSVKSPKEIVNFYREEAEAAGIDVQIEADINGGKMLGGEGDNGTTFSVSAHPTEDNTTAQLVISEQL